MKQIVSVILLFIFCTAEAQRSGKLPVHPNILFCIADDAGLPQFGAYGMANAARTPAFNTVASQGLLLMNVYTPNAKCGPSRSCIITGRNPWQLEAAANHNAYFPEKFTTFIEALGERGGYEVGYTGKGWGPGNPGIKNGKERLLTGPAYNQIKDHAPTSEISNVDYAANFEAFLKDRPANKPFFFWYGSHEPHRGYEYGSGQAKGGMKLSDIKEVPPFWLDTVQVRNDMLDANFETEYFDHHLQQMLALLKKYHLSDNTIVIVTSDNGPPFPRMKGHVYAFDNHLPMAILWKGHIINPGRKIYDYVSFIDLAPTILQLAGLSQEKTGMQPIEGKSFVDILRSTSGTFIDPGRDHVLVGRERTDVGRPHDEGYPVRGIVKGKFMYTRNYEPERWPSGNPETGYMDTDGSPTKTVILATHRNGDYMKLWQLCFGKRKSEELYDLKKDPYCMHNLTGIWEYLPVKDSLKAQMEEALRKQGDPRMFGKGYLFDQYPYAAEAVRDFYDRNLKDKQKAGWINETDFEQGPVRDSCNCF